MKIELLYIDDCPNSQRASELIAAALGELGNAGVEVVRTLVKTADDLEGTVFAGSPTITLDGVDLFPGTPVTEVSCRVYPTPEGLAGAPTLGQLKSALQVQGFGPALPQR